MVDLRGARQGGRGPGGVAGGPGADRLTGGAGADDFDGGKGDDVIGGLSARDVLRGRDGSDTLDLSRAASGLTVILDGLADDGPGAGDRQVGSRSSGSGARDDDITGGIGARRWAAAPASTCSKAALATTCSSAAGGDTRLGPGPLVEGAACDAGAT